jgi:serine/threonine-protein kinase
VPGLPVEIRDLIRACMAKVPEARPRSADAALALWDILDRYAGRLPVPSWN